MEKKIKFYIEGYNDGPDITPSKIEDIVGKTPVDISSGEEEIVFLFDDGTACRFYHEQSCCEIVSVDDVNGDWGDLIGTPLLVAEERTNSDLPSRDDDDSWTWTFYTFRSIKGSVDVRWYGESNGCYSEEVDFCGGIVEP